MDGSDSKFRWQNFIPQSQNIHAYNPERGFVSSANQFPVDSTYPYYVYDHNYEMYRNRRINTMLDSLQNIKFEDLQNLHNDNYNLQAAEALQFLLK